MPDMHLSDADRPVLADLIAKRGGVLNLLGRQNLLERAGLDELVGQLDLAAATADDFSWSLVRALQRWGTLAATGQPALVSLVRELRRAVRGHEGEAAFLDRLLAPYDGASGTVAAAPDPPEPPAPKSPDAVPPGRLTVLFLAANPRETDVLRLGAEARTIEERLHEAGIGDRFDLPQQHAVRWSDVSLRLLRHKPDVVHFAGHGTADGELVFETDDGAAFVPPADVLGGLFGTLKDNIRCVVLNACWSEGQARAIGENIDFVIGMRRPVPDDAAIRFAAGFYRGLGFHRSVHTAFDLGRNEMAALNPALYDVPLLLVRPGADAASTLLLPPRAGDGGR
ncbi:MAG: CHAT domain-containing protein [Ardenticatenales bacterium]